VSAGDQYGSSIGKRSWSVTPRDPGGGAFPSSRPTDHAGYRAVPNGPAGVDIESREPEQESRVHDQAFHSDLLHHGDEVCGAKLAGGCMVWVSCAER
jgi:hypothetical protein